MEQPLPICSICIENILEGGARSTAKLQCGHQFHLDCIGSAFNMKGAMECPNCRRVEHGHWLYGRETNTDNLDGLINEGDYVNHSHPHVLYQDPYADPVQAHLSTEEFLSRLPTNHMFWLQDVMRESEALPPPPGGMVQSIVSIFTNHIEEFVPPFPPGGMIRSITSIFINRSEEFVPPFPPPSMLHGGLQQYPPPTMSSFSFPPLPPIFEPHPSSNHLPHIVPHVIPHSSSGNGGRFDAVEENPPSELLGPLSSLCPYPQQQLENHSVNDFHP